MKKIKILYVFLLFLCVIVLGGKEVNATDPTYEIIPRTNLTSASASTTYNITDNIFDDTGKALFTATAIRNNGANACYVSTSNKFRFYGGGTSTDGNQWDIKVVETANIQLTGIYLKFGGTKVSHIQISAGDKVVETINPTNIDDKTVTFDPAGNLTIKTVNGTGQTYVSQIILSYISTVTKYSVTYYSIGGNYTPTQQPVEANETILEPTAPTKDGHRFSGWYDNAEYVGTPIVFPYTVDSNKDLYAKWIEMTDIEKAFAALETKASIMFGYKKDTVQKLADELDLSGTSLAFKNELISYTYETKGATVAPVINSNTLRIYQLGSGKTEGSTLTFTAKNNLTFCKVVVTIASGGSGDHDTAGHEENIAFFVGDDEISSQETSGKTRTYVIETDNVKSFVIKNKSTSTEKPGGRLYISNIQMYELSNGYAFTENSPSLRFGALIPVAIYDAIGGATNRYGVEINGVEPVGVDFTPVRVNAQGIANASGDYYQFALVLTDIPTGDLNTLITARVFVEISDGTDTIKVYMQDSQHSFVSVATEYLKPENIASVTGHEDILEYIVATYGGTN